MGGKKDRNLQDYTSTVEKKQKEGMLFLTFTN